MDDLDLLRLFAAGAVKVTNPAEWVGAYWVDEDVAFLRPRLPRKAYIFCMRNIKTRETHYVMWLGTREDNPRWKALVHAGKVRP